MTHDALLSTIPSRQKPKQVATTTRYLNGWWLPRIGHMPIDQITAADLNGVIADAREEVKDAACDRILAATAVVFRHAEAAEVIDRIPTTRATRMREGRVIPVVCSAAELTKVLDNTDAEWRRFIELMTLAGLRQTEAIEARVGDLDLDNGQLIVRGGNEGTKSKQHRIVPILSTRLHDMLSAAIQTGRKEGQAAPVRRARRAAQRNRLRGGQGQGREGGQPAPATPRPRVAGACRRGQAARGFGANGAGIDGAQHAVGHRALHAPRSAQRRGRGAVRPAEVGGRAVGGVATSDRPAEESVPRPTDAAARGQLAA